MIYKYPSKFTLTEMAVWIDAERYRECNDQEQLVEYLYRLIYVKAKQLNFFQDEETYDDFVLFCVSKILIRFNNNNEQKVKSITNYIKTVMTPWYNEYVRAFCSGSAELDIADFNVVDFSDYLVDTASLYDADAYCFSCFRVSDAVRHHLRKIPKKKFDSEWSNIYLSCMLTLNDRIRAAAALLSKNVSSEHSILVTRVIRGMKTRPPILFHLEESMSNYVSVLVNEITHAISAELTRQNSPKVTSDACLKGLVAAALNNEEDS